MKNRISGYTGIILFVVGFLSSYLLFRYCAAEDSTETASTQKKLEVNCEVTSFRKSGYSFTKPLLYVEKSCESPDFLPLKNAVTELIRSLKASDDITTASVYVRDFDHSSWMGVNESDGFHPGSLLKVPLLMAYLSRVSFDPTLMDKEYLFTAPPEGELPKQNYLGLSIESGKKYTLRTLLHYLIVESDNNAHWMLHKMMPRAEYEKVFLNLNVNIPLPDPTDSMLRMSAHDYSIFFRALYNGSYLSPEMSEYALSLLGEVKFSEGLVKGFPAGAKLVHKFGEYDNSREFELHECGIVYAKEKAYLVTIMTRGNSRSKLPKAVATLANVVYHQVIEP
jgi:beta-lactamase class A